MNTASSLVLLAAGGTGGHVFPAEALARELILRGIKVALVTDNRGGVFGDDLGNIPVYRVRAATTGRGLMSKLRGGLSIAAGFWQARKLMKNLKPAVVVGFGGYPSVPTILAAAQTCIPVVLHEQNATLGRANRMLARFATRIATSFPKVGGLEIISRSHVTMTGNPVRPAIAALSSMPYPEVTEDGPLYLLVMGGSQGARIFSDVIPAALALLPETLRRRIRLSQQCRAEDLETVKSAYAAQGVNADLATFFRDVPERMASCHLAVCRSGASTVSELTAIGRPAILVPYPHALTGEQAANAEAVAEAGGAWHIPQAAFSPEALAVRLESLLTLPDSLIKTAGAARAWGTIDAASRLATCVVEVAGIEDNDHHLTATLSEAAA